MLFGTLGELRMLRTRESQNNLNLNYLLQTCTLKMYGLIYSYFLLILY